jgi:hypothetical protein
MAIVGAKAADAACISKEYSLSRENCNAFFHMCTCSTYCSGRCKCWAVSILKLSSSWSP